MSLIHLHNYEAFLLDYSEGNLTDTAIAELKAFVVSHPELEIDLNDFDLPYITHENQPFDLKDSLKKTYTEVPDEELLNYLENKLSPELRISFEYKLANDKDLAKDLEVYKKTILLADTKQVFEFKSDLQKTEDDFILNNRIISYLENQLPLTEKIEFEKELITNQELQKGFQLISKTILWADESIIYPDKEALKKENKVIALFSLRTIGSMAAAILLLLGFAVIYTYTATKPASKENLAVNNKILKNLKTFSNSIKGVTIKKDSLEKEVQYNSFDKILAKEPVKTQTSKELQKENIKTNDDENSTELTLIEGKEPEKKIVPQEEQKIEIALNIEPKNFIDTILSQQNYLLVTEELADDEELSGTKKSNKKGFWKRAVQLAKQANKLGVKSIDGQENSQNKYRLSFNSFSVEKK